MDELRGFAKLKKKKKKKKKIIALNSHPNFFWKPITDMDRTLKL